MWPVNHATAQHLHLNACLPRNAVLLLFVWLCVLGVSGSVLAHEDGNPLLSTFMLNKLEQGAGKDRPQTLDAEAWLGYDFNKLWLKVESDAKREEVEKTELQLLYSLAIAPFWDVQMGVRHDFRRGVSRRDEKNWAVLGFEGLAPYFFDVNVALFIRDEGETALHFDAAYDLLFSQRLILRPEFSVNVNGYNDATMKQGAGVADVNAGLRLRYEIRREFAPYIGWNYQKSYGNTAAFKAAAGEDSHQAQWLLGIKAWY